MQLIKRGCLATGSGIQDKKKENQELLDYVKANKQTEWVKITSNIPTKYVQGIFILQEGELEDYIGKSTSNKLENVIDFCKSRLASWYSSAVNGTRVKEFNDIYNSIIK